MVARLTAQYDQQQAHCAELAEENALLRRALGAASTTPEAVEPRPAVRVLETSNYRWEVVQNSTQRVS